jgi:hypothetical protein
MPSDAKISKYVLQTVFCFINGFLWFNCDILLFAYFRSCLQTGSYTSMANRATQKHVTLFVNTNESKHRPQQQKASDIVCKHERK